VCESLKNSVYTNSTVWGTSLSAPACTQASMRTGPWSMPHVLKLTCAAASLSVGWLVTSIWPSRLHQFEP
jgi:hypothetical protein